MSEQIDLTLLAQSGVEALGEISSLEALEEARVKFFGDKSQLQQAQKRIPQIDPTERKEYGRQVNAARQALQESFEQAKLRVEETHWLAKIEADKPDLTLPGIRPNQLGALHPITIIAERVSQIFGQMGFQSVTGLEIETEYYNFTALNTPPGHPARDAQDTFYTDLGGDYVLRSHTSPVQIRALEEHGCPLRVMTYGKVYRNEETNARKLPFFHQMEILCVEEGIHFGHLKWTLERFIAELFGSEIEIRLRPDFFPFTEPSAEVDALCPFCKGSGCSTCGGKGWLELLGCGLVDPNVMAACKLEYPRYTGFAAGLGLERLAMIAFGIADIRELYRNDIRFLSQFEGMSYAR